MLQAVLPFLAKLGAVALKVGSGAAKAGSMAAKGAGGATKFMNSAAPFMEALGSLTGGGHAPTGMATPPPINGASAPMGIASLNSAAPSQPGFAQQMPSGMDPMMMEMLRRQRGMM